jgi:hypothetical protein
MPMEEGEPDSDDPIGVVRANRERAESGRERQETIRLQTQKSHLAPTPDAIDYPQNTEVLMG